MNDTANPIILIRSKNVSESRREFWSVYMMSFVTRTRCLIGVVLFVRISAQYNKVYLVQMLQLLLESGADVNIRDEQQRTPLHLAVVANRPQAVRHLLNNGLWLDESCSM